MSAARPNCTICLHADAKEIDVLVKQGTALGRIVTEWMRKSMNAKTHGRIVKAFNRQSLKGHAEECLGMVAEIVRYVPPGDISVAVPPEQQAPIPLSVSAAELADPKRRLDLLREALAQRIGDLSADKLYAMYMAELKLQTAQAERDSKSGSVTPPPTPDEDGLGDAIAQAAGHLPDLRVVAGGRREVARR